MPTLYVDKPSVTTVGIKILVENWCITWFNILCKPPPCGKPRKNSLIRLYSGPNPPIHGTNAEPDRSGFSWEAICGSM
jgi:hypothetical protein